MANSDCHARRLARPASARPLYDPSVVPTCITCGATEDLEFLDLPRCHLGPPSGWYCPADAMSAIGLLVHQRALARLTRSGIAVPPLIAHGWQSFGAARRESGASALHYSLEFKRAVRKLLEVIDHDA